MSETSAFLMESQVLALPNPNPAEIETPIIDKFVSFLVCVTKRELVAHRTHSCPCPQGQASGQVLAVPNPNPAEVETPNIDKFVSFLVHHILFGLCP